MSDLKLFRITGPRAVEVQGSGLALERSLQTLIEQNLSTFLGVTFLASEFPTGPEHGGRMDTLGLDENKCPVIIEYKRSTNMNVINQGLFYLDWLVTHRGDFEMLVLKTLGVEAAQAVEWSSPRLICNAGDFNKFDAHAIKQMNRNIDLIRYVKFGEDHVLLEQINAAVAPVSGVFGPPSSKTPAGRSKHTAVTGTPGQDRCRPDGPLRSRARPSAGPGSRCAQKVLRLRFACNRIKNFACASG